MFDSGDYAWILISSALVLLMTPGLAFFYGGMVRSKNILGMLMQNFYCMGIVSVLWGAIVYSLAFGNAGDGGFVGNFDFAWMDDLVTEGPIDNTNLLFFVFQLTFAIITPALITGAIADRMRFSAWVWFVGLWVILVYAPVAHWVFAGGWLAELGSLDFAGGAVVHINAGAAALAAAVILGKRLGWPKTQMAPHSLPWTMLGAGILWFGWFGFNAGSALGANGGAVQAWWNTNLAAGAAMLAWLVVERFKTGHATTLGAASGLVAGLVAITPCAGFVDGMSGAAIGAFAGVAAFFAIQLKYRFGYDDSLDVVGVHLVGGLVGSLLLGFFATESLAGVGSVFFGGEWGLLGDQAVASFATLGYSLVVSAIILLVLKVVLPGGIRVTEDEEVTGLDLSQHAETGYSFGDLQVMARES